MRLKRSEKLKLARDLSEAAIRLGEPYWTRKGLGNNHDEAFYAEFDGLEAIYRSRPNTMECPSYFSVAIWTPNHKVFEFHWDSCDIVRFKYGPWMNKIIPGSFLT